jgi:polyisoprenoid-binding protein YceI
LLSTISICGCANLVTTNSVSELSNLRKGQYRIDPRHTTLIFKVNHLGLSTFVGRFNQVDATLDFSPDNLNSTQLNAVVSTSSIDVNEPGLEQMLKGKKWFNIEQFPEAMYSTISVESLSDNSFEFTGNLTFMGVTAPVTMNAIFHGGADNLLTGKYTLGFSATGSFNRSQFGMGKYTSLVGDEVELEVFAEFIRE